MRGSPDILGTIGDTPCCRLNRLPDPEGAEVVLKLEFVNPGRSVKDRAALEMIRDAERTGKLKPGGGIVEATSGNTGVGLALVGAALGYRVIVVMPELMGHQRAQLIRALGGQVKLTPSLDAFHGAVFQAQELAQEKGYFMPDQWSNPANVEVHRRTTGPEILRQTDGRVDAFVAGVGTGGTITGVGEVLKQHNPSCRVIAVEPAVSAVLSGGKPGWTRIFGIGAGFVPSILNRDLLDEIMTVTDEAAIRMSQDLALREGISAGVSTGANVVAALRIAGRMRTDQRVVTVAPDTGDRYFGHA